MVDNPITRKEKYLAKLTGSYTGNVPDPITRVEKYLYDLCQKGISGLTPEEIENAVNKYLKENPVQPGATTEQAQQIEQNKTDIASLKTETGSLKEDISNKITKFYASSQGETHLADSDNGKIMDMVLYGRSEQKQYSGKNLLNATLQTTTQNGVTCTANGDGTYTINGTATSDTLFHIGYFIFEKDTKYKIVGCPQGGSLNTLYRLDGSLNANSDTGNGIVYSGDGNKRNARIVVFNGATVNNLLFKPMITTDLTATYDDFEPYTGGIPSPNPDYPQEIKSVVNPTVKIVGKNLLNAALGTTTKNGITCTANGDGTFTLNGTATNTCLFTVINNDDLKKTFGTNENLRLTASPKGASKTGYYLQMWKNEPEIIYNDTGGGVTVEKPNAKCNVSIVIKNGTVCNNVLFKPMLTTDLTATYDDFEPYHEQTVTLPYTLNAIPVSSGGNVTIDGQQYIADYVDVERGKLVRMVGEFVQNNQEWRTEKVALSYSVFSAKTPINNIQQNDDILNYCSNYFKCIATNKRYSENTLFINSGYFLIVTMPSGTIIDDFLALVKGKLKVFYELATPIETDLTPEEVQAFKALATYYPVTNISVNSEQLNGYTVFNYPISMENGWNYVKQQIGDTRDYIYDMDARTRDTDLQAAEAYVNSEYAVALTELEV